MWGRAKKTDVIITIRKILRKQRLGSNAILTPIYNLRRVLSCNDGLKQALNLI
jgi:hypothetical protein